MSSSRDGSAKNPAVIKVDGQEGSIRKYETDESSTVDESSLVSLAEDRQNFEKLEREAEVNYVETEVSRGVPLPF